MTTMIPGHESHRFFPRSPEDGGNRNRNGNGNAKCFLRKKITIIGKGNFSFSLLLFFLFLFLFANQSMVRLNSPPLPLPPLKNWFVLGGGFGVGGRWRFFNVSQSRGVTYFLFPFLFGGKRCLVNEKLSVSEGSRGIFNRHSTRKESWLGTSFADFRERERDCKALLFKVYPILFPSREA